jgi:hypothetical protein
MKDEWNKFKRASMMTLRYQASEVDMLRPVSELSQDEKNMRKMVSTVPTIIKMLPNGEQHVFKGERTSAEFQAFAS